MAYAYKNGMRYLITEEPDASIESNKESGYHYHSDISIKIGTNLHRTIKIHADDRHGAGKFIPFKVKMQKINSVKLNNQILQPKIDYIIKDNSAIAFTFNLMSSDKIEIEGII